MNILEDYDKYIIYCNYSECRARIPVSNAVTAMEVWLLACMMLVFFSLVEYTVILRRSVAHNRTLEIMKRDANIIKNSNGVSADYSNDEYFKREFENF